MNFMLLHVLVLSAVVIWTAGAIRCPDGWVSFQESCYLFIDEFVPWTSAKVYCDTLGEGLLEVGDAEENNFIASQLRKLGLKAAWQGLTDLAQEGKWVWVSNRMTVDYTNWRPGEPSNVQTHENGEDCVEVQFDGFWNDLWCEDIAAERLYRPSPVCEMEGLPEEVVG